MDDKVVEVADYLLSQNKTYRDARIACEKLFARIAHEIELRALEEEITK